MRIVRYLFLLLLAITMTSIFAGQAHAATEKTDNETPASVVDQKTEPVVNVKNSEEVVKATSETKVSSVQDSNSTTTGSGTISTNANGPTTQSDKDVATVQLSESSNTSAVSTNSNPLTAGLAAQVGKSEYGIKRVVHSAVTASNSLAQKPSEPQLSSQTPTPTRPVPAPAGGGAVWFVLANILSPTVISAVSFVTLSASLPTSHTQKIPSAILVGLVVSFVLLSAWQMRMLKSGFTGAARSAGLHVNNLLSIFRRERMGEFQNRSLFYSLAKTNHNILKGGTA